jgi:hypothetical protein
MEDTEQEGVGRNISSLNKTFCLSKKKNRKKTMRTTICDIERPVF